jgi:prephenate dehydratase
MEGRTLYQAGIISSDAYRELNSTIPHAKESCRAFVNSAEFAALNEELDANLEPARNANDLDERTAIRKCEAAQEDYFHVLRTSVKERKIESTRFSNVHSC